MGIFRSLKITLSVREYNTLRVFEKYNKSKAEFTFHYTNE